jgi:type I restriction enzyme M protein
MKLTFKSVSLGDKRYFLIERGERIRKEDINKAKGTIPVYSGSKDKGSAIGYVSDEIKKITLTAKKFNGKFLTVNANGSVGKVFLREGEFYLNDIVNVVKILDKNILQEYLLFELQNEIDALGYGSWSRKLYKQELKQEVSVNIPVKENGEFDLEKQKEIAEKYQKILEIKNKMQADYKNVINAKIQIIETED